MCHCEEARRADAAIQFERRDCFVTPFLAMTKQTKDPLTSIPFDKLTALSLPKGSSARGEED